MEQVDATFNQVGQEMNQLTQQIRTTISDMHVRLGVLEEININPNLQADREAIVNGTFTIDRFKTIAEEVVIPEMKARAEEVQKEMKVRWDKLQVAMKEGLTPEEAVARVDGEMTVNSNEPKIEIVSS